MTRHAYTKYDPTTRQWVFDTDKARKAFAEDASVDHKGIIRWKSNGRVPPDDCLADFAELGLPFNIAATKAEYEAETQKFLSEYRKREANRKPSAEELFEMRAAFGEGAEVVNVITGRKTKL
jgi:hypothetical protein